jgi:hypothetical protein
MMHPHACHHLLLPKVQPPCSHKSPKDTAAMAAECRGPVLTGRARAHAHDNMQAQRCLHGPFDRLRTELRRTHHIVAC